MSSRTLVTYAIMAHSRESQLLRLVKALREESPHSSVVIHWDSRARPLEMDFCELGNVHLVPDPAHPEWGDFGMVEAVLKCMEAAVAQTQFEWFVLLSGQDYPLAPLERIERDLGDAGCDAFLDARRVASGRLSFRWRRSETTRLGRRYYFSYWRAPTLAPYLPRRLRSALMRFLFLVDAYQPLVSVWPMPAGVPWRVGIRRLWTPFGRQRPCRVGSSWFSISRRGVHRVLDRSRAQPHLVRYYRRTVHPDESFFQTLICADPELQVSPNINRFQVWEAGGSPLHPNILTVDEAQELLRSRMHFARKLDADVDSQVLDLIDDHRRNESREFDSAATSE